MPEYVAVLAHLHGFHAAVDPAVGAALADLPEAAPLADVSREAALRDDLAWFGAPARPFPGPAPRFGDAASALGALYVLEGSGLGARVIARHVSASLGVAPGRGGAFYGGNTAQAARDRWNRLCRILAARDEGEDGPMLAGALTAFAMLEAWMRQVPPASS